MRVTPLSVPRWLLAGLVAFSFNALVFADAHAQWKWRDKTGQINASDRPPPNDIPEKDVLSRPLPDLARRPAPAASAAASAPVVAAVPGPLERELEAKKRAADQEQAAKLRAEQEKVAGQRAENCRRARGHVTALETGQRIARINDKGEREVIDDRGRAEELRRAREVITADCK